ncbi:MAG: type II secretion system minor pseudopilin GspK [Pseudomonadota bacterium]|nr:type II secretion system minor pseudopilin GspK [Pseudomonadota bacterium]
MAKASAAAIRRQSGVALLTVLLVVFLAGVAAASLATVQQFAIRRSGLLLHQQQARLYALGGEALAALVLRQDLENDRQQGGVAKDHLNEAWATESPVFPIEGGVLSGRIEDLQSCFNLNNLVPEADSGTGTPDDSQAARQRAAFGRLLNTLNLNPDLIDAITDWIDPDQDQRTAGAEDAVYLSRDPAYLTAGRYLESISELRLIDGIDPEVYDALAPHVCALPPGSTLNINTASSVVLTVLQDDLSEPELKARLETRPAEGYDDVDQFLLDFGIDAENSYPKANLTVASRHFRVRIAAEVGDGRWQLTSVVERDDQGRVRVLRRTFGNDEFTTP